MAMAPQYLDEIKSRRARHLCLLMVKPITVLHFCQ